MYIRTVTCVSFVLISNKAFKQSLIVSVYYGKLCYWFTDRPERCRIQTVRFLSFNKVGCHYPNRSI